MKFSAEFLYFIEDIQNLDLCDSEKIIKICERLIDEVKIDSVHQEWRMSTAKEHLRANNQIIESYQSIIKTFIERNRIDSEHRKDTEKGNQ